MTSSLAGISIDLLGVLDALDDPVANARRVKRAGTEVLEPMPA